MKYRPLITILLVLTSIVVTLGAPAFDSSLYGVNGHPVEWLSFSPGLPFRHLGLSLFLSPFIHLNTLHLFTNLAFLIPMALMMERKRSGRFLAMFFFSIHFVVMLTLVGIENLFPSGGNAFLGSSHVVVGLYSYWSLSQKRYGLLFFTLLIIAAGLWENQNPLTLLAHTLGLFSGILLFVLGRLWCKIRAKSTN